MSSFVKLPPPTCKPPPPQAVAPATRAAEQRMIVNDPHLVGLGPLLANDQLIRVLAPAFAAHRIGLTTVQTTYLRYKPGASCLAAFDAMVDGQATHGYAVAYRAGDAKFTKRASSPAAAIHEGLCVAAYLFPYDHALRAAAAWVNAPSDAARTWGLDSLGDDPLQLELLRYKPERRIVARILRAGNPWGVLRLYAPRDFQVAQRNAKALGEIGPITTARRLGRSQNDHALLVEWLPGQTLGQKLLEGAAGVDDFQQVGEMLGRLHQWRCYKLQRFNHDDDAVQIAVAARAIAQMLPEYDLRAGDLAAKIGAFLKTQPRAVAVRHGDFYADQALIGCMPALIDLDQSGRGDPAYDLGNFYAHLVRSAVLGRLGDDEVETYFAGLIDGYRQASPEPRRAVIAAYSAGSLLRLVLEPFRQRDPDWVAVADELLQRAERLAEQIAPADANVIPARTIPTSTTRASASSPFALIAMAMADPELPQLQSALDWREAERRLPTIAATAATGQIPCRLTSIDVMRHKMGRRCLVAYRMESIGDVRGKVDKLELLGKTMRRLHAVRDFEQHRALYDSPFGQGADDEIGLPEPLGVLPEWNMWFQRRVSGTTATPTLATSSGPRLSARIAKALVRLHCTGPPPKRVHGLSDEMTILENGLRKAIELRSDLASRIGVIAARCRHLAATMPAGVLRPSHRDFYPDQILVDEERLWVCDFDLYALADSALDVGNFAAHLIEQGLRCSNESLALAASRKTFVDRYCELDSETSRESIEAYETLSLARHIGLSLILPGRSAAVEGLIALCEERLSV